MMKKILGILVLALVASPAFGEMIDFDPFPSIPSDVTVQYFNDGLTGPLGSLPTPNGVALQSGSSAVSGGGAALSVWNGNFGPYGVLFTFSFLQSAVSMIGNDFGGDRTLDNEIVYLTAFNSSGDVIGSSSYSSAWANPNLKPININIGSANIKYIAFTWTNDLGYYNVDNVEYTSSAVPEPATMLLLGLGLVGLAGVRRKMQK